ncbi:3',5'-cyclic adenosine monophosphate phosphodiesterase CpdA [Streptomyces tendae]
MLTCPGNHDSRAPYRKALLGRPAADGPVNGMHVFDGAAVLMCDSSIPGSDEGELDEETYAWIEASLDGLDGDMPALLAFHHPPTPVHHPLPDSCRLRHPERLAALLERRPRIAGLITGHAHTPAATVFAGRPLMVGPGVTWTLRLPWEGEEIADRSAGRARLPRAGRRRTAHEPLPHGGVTVVSRDAPSGDGRQPVRSVM